MTDTHIRIREREKENAQASCYSHSVALLSAGFTSISGADATRTRRGIRRGLFCRFDTVSPWRQLKGYRVSYDRRRRLSPAAGIIKLKSHCAAALRSAAAQQSTFLLSFRETLPVSRPRVTREPSLYSRTRRCCSCYETRIRLVKSKSREKCAIKCVSSMSDREFITPFHDGRCS